jgi:hypothetical protein
VIRTNVDFQIENRACRRHQAVIFRKRRPRYVAVFWQLSVKAICLNHRIFLAYTKGSKEKLCAMREARPATRCTTMPGYGENFSDFFAVQESLVGHVEPAMQ